jgi:hypothetical protein
MQIERHGCLRPNEVKMENVFVAYASGNSFLKDIIEESCSTASSASRVITPWSTKDASGNAINKSVQRWIEDANSIVVDISEPNHNVIYELGLAIGMNKAVRLIRSTHSDFGQVQKIGLVDTLVHDKYDFQPQLTGILRREVSGGKWDAATKNKDQPVFVFQPPKPGEMSRRSISAIKKLARLKFRNFNPAEISRLTATEAFEHVSASFGVVAFWEDSEGDDSLRNNQRASFILGLARGLDVPAVLITPQESRLPLDFHDTVSRWSVVDDVIGIISSFRDNVAEEIFSFVDPTNEAPRNALKRLDFGDPIAENEQARLSEFFLETDAYNRALSGSAHVLTGRKGSGKSAIFLQIRDRCRTDKQNIIVDLMPEGYQLIKLKEYILDRVSLGTRKQIIGGFWEYIIWLEIAYKILEKDRKKHLHDSEIFDKYRNLETIFHKRSDTGIGDFSERLKILSDNIINRFVKSSIDPDKVLIDSSVVLEIIYGEDIKEIRESVLDYLKIKGFVYFLFDNLDRVWTPGGFTSDDATLLIGLAEAMQEIERRFKKRDLSFRWALFIRSDVYEHLVAGMADYGKLSAYSIEWSDREQLISLFNHRLNMEDEKGFRKLEMDSISDKFVDGIPVLEYLIDKCLMRPRYLIRLFETARRRALTLNKEKIEESDYQFATRELGWQVLEDFDREIADIVPDGSSLLFEILTHHDDLTPDKLRYICQRKIIRKELVEKFIEVLIWSGALGIVRDQKVVYIFDCGYSRQYMSSLIESNGGLSLSLHPTLMAASDGEF